jgi:hypothetical protein
MNPCHAASLALVGWYLMMPPWGKVNAPLSEWVVYQSFDSAEVCAVARKALVDFQGNYKGMAMTLITQSGATYSSMARWQRALLPTTPA